MTRKQGVQHLILGAFCLGLAMAGVQAAEIDFEGLPPGTIVTQLSSGAGISGPLTGVVNVRGRNDIFPNRDAAIVFDSSCTVTPLSDCDESDRDLGTPHMDFGGPGIGDGGAAGGLYPNTTALGNLLVLAKDLVDSNGDGLIDDPDDADVPGFVEFDFSNVGKGKGAGTVTINSVTIMDVELDENEVPALIEMSGPGILTSTIAQFNTDNGGVATVSGINLSGVRKLTVHVKGSSALASVVFQEDEPGLCWITTGGFQNAGLQSGGKDYTFGGNVGPPPSGSWEVVDHNTGDNFHSHDVEIVECKHVDTSTGPGQPGGKKGFDINYASFAGTGRLNGVDGYPFTGYVIDSGEPGGKQGNTPDYYEIIVTHPVSGLVVFAASGNLDGGNVQIHPPTGSTN